MNGDVIHSGYESVPENLKVRTIGQINDPDADYSFDYFWVFEHIASGRLFYGRDSGCSCPSPFENDHFNGPNDTSFTEITLTNCVDVIKDLYNHYPGSSQDEKREIESEVRTLLSDKKRKETKAEIITRKAGEIRAALISGGVVFSPEPESQFKDLPTSRQEKWIKLATLYVELFR